MFKSKTKAAAYKAPSWLKLPAESANLLVIGNGMVGHHFLKQLVDRGLHKKYTIKVVGEESLPAYNRIKLGEYVDHSNTDQLILDQAEWYQKHNIQLKLNQRAVFLNRQDKYIELGNGDHLHYDLLVLATGSRPTIPSFDGVDSPHVLTYRNIADLKKIITHFSSAKDIAVIGGGLLGIEAAHTFQKLGVKTTIIQRANFLMTRQLNTDAAKALEKKIEAAGIHVITQAQKAAIEARPDGNYLTINDENTLKADYVLISAGITPNTEFAAEAGIECGLHGGCMVNGRMQTNDPSIFAIGECAQYEGQVYGLAAPGFEMAKHLAALIASEKKKPLKDLDTSTRLKMTGVDVSVIGEPLEKGRQVVYENGGDYRMITIDKKRRVTGAMAIGPWDEYADIHHAYLSKQKLPSKQLELFETSGALFKDDNASSPLGWAPSRMVCSCMSVTKGEIMDAIAQIGNEPSAIAEATKASTVCGSCDYILKGLCGQTQPATARPKVAKGLLITSILALLVVIAAIALPPAPVADSVTSFWSKVDQLWRDNVIKQITGFTMLAVFTIGLLVSLRKRLPWFNFGKYSLWRYFHVAFGLVSLVVLYAHTGFHFGYNLNFWLMLVFIILNLLGALTGVVMALENTSNATVARLTQVLRPYMLWGHIILFWPLPVLVAFHIMSVYKY